MSWNEDRIYGEDEKTRSTKLRFPASVLSSSPSERFWSQTISSTLERRMNKNVYKNGKRCLIENTLNDGSLHYVHCLSRRLESRRLNDFEFAWNMKRGTLNLDTRSNVFCLGAKFKALWEENKWLLLPEDHVLECYFKAAKKGRKFPDIGDGPYKYRLIVHPDMQSVPIHRQIIFPEIETEGLKADHFTFSSFPYKDFDTLTSHIHPKYAICRIGARPSPSANMLMIDYGEAVPDALARIIKCIDIVSIWSSNEEDVASKHTRFLKSQIDPSDVLSDTSDRTANCRLRPYVCDKRLIEEYNYVYVKEEDGIKLKHKEDAPHLLTAKKLRMFDEQMFLRQTTKTRSKVILSWRLAVSGDPEELE